MVTREQPEDYFGDGIGAERQGGEDVLPAVGSDLVELGFALSGDVVGEDVLDGGMPFLGRKCWGGVWRERRRRMAVVLSKAGISVVLNIMKDCWCDKY